MEATVLIDNIAGQGLSAEWGLSIYIEYNGKKILLDTGASGQFLENARKLGIDLAGVDYAVLSHAHYDHGDGMGHFFRENRKADFYLREGSGENCYIKYFLFRRYIGIKKGTLQAYGERIVYAGEKEEICEGVYLISHKAEGLGKIGKQNHMYIKRKGWQPDDFSHEQSLVFDTSKGLAVFNSCCHAGADTVIREAAEAFPEKEIYAVVGGFHLVARTEAQVRALAGRIRETGIQKVYTGHCTGEKAYRVLKEELGSVVEQLHTGLVIAV